MTVSGNYRVKYGITKKGGPSDLIHGDARGVVDAMKIVFDNIKGHMKKDTG